LLNLARNACQATGGVESPRILVSSRSVAPGLVEVCVRDNGRGLDAEAKTNLFTAFSKSTTGGLGLGSSICRTIVEAHDGRIWAENNEGGGASFYFTLPKAADPPRNAALTS
jgi:two-component system sensor kinase FixL